MSADNSLFKIVNFTPGSYIVLEGEKKSNTFYIIRDGKVNLKKDFPVAGEKANETLGIGDFFGVIGAMSQYPQIESAIALTNVTLIAVTNNRFGDLIQKNTPVAMKIIRYFSQKLRQFNGVTGTPKILNRSADLESYAQLFNIAEYYYSKGNTPAATYVYQSYLKYLPSGPYVEPAKKKLKMLGAPLTFNPQTGSNRSFKRDEMIFCENEPGEDLFIIQSGMVKIVKVINDSELLLYIMKNGDIFGEMAILDNKPRSASVIAMDDVEVLAINKSNFENMVKTQPQLMSRIVTLLSERIWNAYKKLANSLITDSIGRIADMLLTLVEKGRAKIAPRAIYNFGIAPIELLQMLGFTDREMALLQKFMNSNKFVKLEQQKIVCTDLALLERLVYFYKEQAKNNRNM